MHEKIRILLIEDVSADAELIRLELRRAKISFDFICVDTKTEFAQQLIRFAPDIVISDFALGQFNALEALDCVQATFPDIPFILVTGSQSEEVAVACIKEGADDYLLKSSLKRLPSAVLGALKKRAAERERAKAENALRQSEELFRSLIENSSDIVAIYNQDGIITYGSPSFERVLGYRPDEVQGASLFQLLHPNETARARNDLLLLNGGPAPSQNQNFELRFRHKSGSWRILEMAAKHLPASQELSGIIANARDVTERKNAEIQIREQAALLDKAKDAILVHDLHNRIGYWNRSAERLYGWTLAEVLGKNVGEFFEKEDSCLANEARKIAFRTGEWHGELRQVTKLKKEIIVESSYTLVCDHEGQPASMLVISTDITEKKTLESQFLRVQRMESIGTLAGGIAHDLNNVLTPILMAIRLLQDEISNPRALKILNTLETSAHRGSAIVQQVLSFARGVEGERSVFQVKHPLTEVVNILRDTLPRSIRIATQIDKDLWPIIGDPTQLHQVFMNLSVNARDAMPNGGRLQIEANNILLDDNYAQMQPEAKAGPYVAITFLDTGVGIPPDLLGKVFEPFFTTKDVGKGTGLGLSTVLGIVRGHGGFLNVYSEVGKGTRFLIHLPAANPLEQPSLDPHPPPLPQGAGELILVADDEPAIREIIRVTLESNNYNVLTACDGAEAVAVFAQKHHEIKAVIVDIMMPYMDGPATIRALQRLDPRTRFIAVSGLLENDKINAVSENGPISFLSKPFTTEQLLATLRALLDANPPEGSRGD